MAFQNQMVNVQIPKTIFRRLRRVAELTHRSIEDVLATTVNVALPTASDLPADLADDLAAMTMFNDDALWAAAKSSLSQAQQLRLDQLTHAGGSRKLTLAESSELTSLLESYDHSVLRRAKALVILTHRGYEISGQDGLLGLPDDGS